MSTVQGRAEELGTFGKRALALLTDSGALKFAEGTKLDYLRDNSNSSDNNKATEIAAEWYAVERISSRYGRRIGFMFNMLWCIVPTQYPLTNQDIIQLLSDVYIARPRKGSSRETRLGRDSDKHFFKVKKDHKGALGKINVYFTDVWADLTRLEPTLAEYINNYSEWVIGLGLYNDQAAAALLHWAGLASHGLIEGLWPFVALVEPNETKVLTILLKSSGNNSTVLGSMLCEMNSLLGRGVNPVDWNTDMSHRIHGTGVESKSVCVDQVLLKAAILDILRRELPTGVNSFTDVDTFWSGRWAWCVNGAHNRYVEDVAPWARADIGESKMRLHRRAYVELMKENPMHRWNGTSYYSTSEKLEHGKSRALYSGDTLTYVCFSHLLRPIEQAWRNKSVVLNPGEKGNTNMVKRVAATMSGKAMNVMLDYEDFNSQHSLESMCTLYTTVCEYLNYDSMLTKRLINSITNGFIVHNGKVMGKMTGSLCSGHRGTSFVNSVLNAAYLRVFAPSTSECTSLHVGDDVFISCASRMAAARILADVIDSPLRISAIKQSVGAYSAEFLRMSITRYEARGYLARSVASVVSGNWENEAKLSPANVIRTMSSQSWTLRNRCSGFGLGKLLRSCLIRATGLSKIDADAVLSHTVSIDGGPIYGRRNDYETWMVRDVMEYKHISEYDLPHYATDAYISEHISPVEKLAVSIMNRLPTNAMVQASFDKSWRTVADCHVKTHLLIERTWFSKAINWRGQHTVLDDAPNGVLNPYPVIQLLKNGLDRRSLVRLCRELGVECDVYNVMEVAFGTRTLGVRVLTPMIYADISALAAATGKYVLQSAYYYYV